MGSFPRLSLYFAAAAAVLLASSCEFSPQKPGEKYALVYGVADYYGNNDLNYTDNDAVAVAQLLVDKGYKVTLRVNGDDTPSPELQNELEDYSTDVTDGQLLNNDFPSFSNDLLKNDIFLFYFSGHGSPVFSSELQAESIPSDPYQECFVLTNASSENYYITDDVFYDKIKNLPSKRNIVLIDSCHSGGFIGQAADIDTIAPQYYEDNENRYGRLSLILNSYFNPESGDITPDEAIVMTAAGEQEVSLESGEVFHGIFTYLFLNSTGNDINGDGVITTTESYAYIRKSMLDWWNPKSSNSPEEDKIDYQYYPRISGGPVDYVLFEAD